MTPTLHDTAVYLGDNGRTFCGEHAGVSARYSGRDLSGHPVIRLYRWSIEADDGDPEMFKCEHPGCDRAPTD